MSIPRRRARDAPRRSVEPPRGEPPRASGIVRRIEKGAGVEDLAAVLGERLPPSDVQAVLLDACRRRASRLAAARLVEYYRENRFVRPSGVDPRDLLAWDLAAFAELPDGYAAVELSPVCPLGTVSGVTGLSQDWAVSTVRNTEVVSDPTNVLALEYATRRATVGRRDPVKLAASHRAVRGQRYGNAAARPHFRLFALCSGGRDTGNLGVELSAISEHASFYLRALRRFLGPEVPLRVSFTEVAAALPRGRVDRGLIDPLRSAFPTVEIGWDPERATGRAYYRRLCFHVHARHADGRERELADGGDVDWAAKLLANGKERLVISGLGTEGLCRDFRPRRE